MAKADERLAEGDGTRRTYVTLPLAQLVPGVTKVAFQKRSPAGAAVMADWAAIVGPRLAASTQPSRLSRGQLTISCSGPIAMELQHLQSALLERINVHAGHRLVDRLRFTQDHVATTPITPLPSITVERQPIEGLSSPLANALAGLLQAIQQRK